MTETQRRIRAYKKALPELRERVVAVALLLAMSASMLASASFAWLTLSMAPEISGVSTTLAANGNLEIALVGPEGNEPEDSKVGDSVATDGQNVAAANLTWGNMVNLSDASYGLDNLTLRPAQLNTYALLTSPLYGAVYSQDGRIEKLSSNFRYTVWQPPKGELSGQFEVSNAYGVRAISSTMVSAEGGELKLTQMMDAADSANANAQGLYLGITRKNDYMQSLATVMGIHLTANLNSSDPTVDQKDLENLAEMYGILIEAYQEEAKALAELLNLQQLLKNGVDENYNIINYDPYTAQRILAPAELGDNEYKAAINSFVSDLKGKGFTITGLDTFLKDYRTVRNDRAKLEELGTSNQVYSNVSSVVANLANVNECYVNNNEGSGDVKVKNIGKSAAMSFLGKKCDAKITNGILYNFECQTGARIIVKEMSIKATYIITASITANIYTTAPDGKNNFYADFSAVTGGGTSISGGKAVAQDTYGLAVDMWVRTNAEGSHLILEGNVLTSSEDVDATCKDADGNTVNLYTVTYQEDVYVDENEDGAPDTNADGSYKTEKVDQTADVYQKADGSWISYPGYVDLTDSIGNNIPTQKRTTITTVIGYEGENRVWADNDQISTDATTQGSGSCYVYYAESPEDQARSMKLLESFKVAFVDVNGTHLATAQMDTKRSFEENGRVTVPLVLDPNESMNLGVLDYTGETAYGIMALNRNEATRITCIIYLDGTKLNNQDVLSAANIQGKLNIQFGTTATMDVINNEKLEMQVRTVSADVDITEFNYDTHEGDMKTTVTVRVDGEAPNTVTGFFLRKVSSTHGTREEKMTFTQQADGTWTAPYIFTSPGTYVLRSVELDGVEYDLEPSNSLPTVTVKGFSIARLDCDKANDKRHIIILSAANSDTANLDLKFVTEDVDKLPGMVQGRFLNDEDGSAVNINFIYNPTTQVWSGTATFLTSGDYTMDYLVMDGEYVGLVEDMHLTASVTLGMRVAVYTDSPTNFLYKPGDAECPDILKMRVELTDNAGNPMPGKSGGKLVYYLQGTNGVVKTDTDLTWNGSYYVGELKNEGPGIWVFGYVVVGESTISTVTRSPSFTIQSPIPPDYLRSATADYQYAPNGKATLDATLKAASAATVRAVIVDQDTGMEYEVDQKEKTGTDETRFTFQIPTKESTKTQDGNWKLKELQLINVYVNGNSYSSFEEGHYYTIEVKDGEPGTVTKVVQKPVLAVESSYGQAPTVSLEGSFLQTHTITASDTKLKFKIVDFEGDPIKNMEEVKLLFNYDGNSKEKGGYSSDKIPAVPKDGYVQVMLNYDDAGIAAQAEAFDLIYAGTYTPVLSYKVTGTNEVKVEKSTLGNMPTFVVSSKTPAVKITAISPTGTFDVDTSGAGNGHTSTTVPAWTATDATVYFKCGRSGDGSTCNPYRHNYTRPSVTITLEGIGTASQATLSFGSGKQIYNGTSQTDGYSWSADGTCVRNIGYYKNKSAANDEKTPAGTLTSSVLTLTHSTGTYEVTLNPAITIRNPY